MPQGTPWEDRSNSPKGFGGLVLRPLPAQPIHGVNQRQVFGVELGFLAAHEMVGHEGRFDCVAHWAGIAGAAFAFVRPGEARVIFADEAAVVAERALALR